jgi:hypothetical protein
MFSLKKNRQQRHSNNGTYCKFWISIVMPTNDYLFDMPDSFIKNHLQNDFELILIIDKAVTKLL